MGTTTLRYFCMYYLPCLIAHPHLLLLFFPVQYSRILLSQLHTNRQITKISMRPQDPTTQPVEAEKATCKHSFSVLPTPPLPYSPSRLSTNSYPSSRMPLLNDHAPGAYSHIDLEAAKLSKGDFQRQWHKLIIRGAFCLVSVLACVVGAPVLGVTFDSKQDSRGAPA